MAAASAGSPAEASFRGQCGPAVVSKRLVLADNRELTLQTLRDLTRLAKAKQLREA